MFEDIKTAWEYFLYYPDKTQVIIQVYILNPLYKILETIVFSVLSMIRNISLIVVESIEDYKDKQ